MKYLRPSDQPENWIGEKFLLAIDRPLGSVHPRYPNLVYELNYGFILGTLAADGSEIDGYLFGVNEQVSQCEGFCIAIIQ